MHIAVAGNIGSGKTTLTELLAKHYNWEAHYEEVDENPYLNDFYDDMQRWSFNLQIYFLKSRFNQIMEIRKSGKNVIQDRTIYEDAMIFAPNLYDMELMSERDFKNYNNLFELMGSMVQAPDLLIYLRSSVPTLVNNIQKRGRNYEETIRLDYLKNLNTRYENWIKNYSRGKLLIIDAENLDFLENPEDLNGIVDKVEAQIHGLF
ncbi:deoxynucleoside kinase [Labilibaculum sp. DW002]|jgi:deoxyadenosine/deoxycytidine kinase|uniref:Deoxynucleoside kinase n=1 Tax=Paralabilibaculum antarcticum TaxID=2912572 RepID=A0ABT5VTB2_9BACT|nr:MULTISPECIES: deoxynucleoside kinase [unclassified Labilibaculum]MBI9056908.1 deoxynucleoside kinase [Labilibaculum sp.]MDE5418547.1 deoxynucleoside kinase [Labilibaculum sp. DW002]